MGFSFEIKLQVPFHDLDPMRIVWHGNYLKYFDQTRFALFEAAGIDLYGYLLEREYAFPITRTSAKHIFPLLPKDEFTCKATVREARFKIAMDFEIRRHPDGKICTRGHSEQLAVKYPSMELEFEIPKEIRKALGFE
jgi:acyl-CoA thioester hydrolase